MANKIYSATYSNVPVYEFIFDGNQVMRRRADDWINATHILKVADFDKPARTRILEREVQKGVHEKVQGGYGKYQGTWVPLPDGRMLAERNGVVEKLAPIFDFVPGDRSPPPAPKHATAASSRPRAPRNNARRAPAPPAPSQLSEDRYDDRSHYPEDETPDNLTTVSESMIDEDAFPGSQYSMGSGHRKRKRGADQMSVQDQNHQIWADALLDYFVLMDSDDRFPDPPEPPPGINLDRPIDDKGHSAMHWAAAMGDLDVVKDLRRRGARIDCLSNNLETPLMRVVLFTNNYDKNTMPSMFNLLSPTVHRTDWFGSTVFHHIASTTQSKSKYQCARYYLDSILNKLAETWVPDEITRLLNVQDRNGDTAIMIAARYGARKCVRSLLGRNAAVDIPNQTHETADDLIRELNARRHDGRHRLPSSSPFAAPDRIPLNGENGTVGFPGPTVTALGLRDSMNVAREKEYRSQTAATLMHKLAPTLLEKCEALAAAYDAEIEEKENEAQEAERVVRKRQVEIETIRKQLSELRREANVEEGMEMGDAETEQEERQMEQELRELTAECEALLEIEQSSELQRLQQQTSKNLNAHNAVFEEMDIDGQALTLEAQKIRLASKLLQAQQERRSLVQAIVGAMSMAGMGERQKEYKRLIIGALGVREEEVQGMLPEILGELEGVREMDV